MAGKEKSQNKKNERKSLVFVPELAAMEFGRSSNFAHMLRIIKYTQVPPIHDCTPYHIHAMAARLNTGHKLPLRQNHS
jgi:hypothetical protein